MNYLLTVEENIGVSVEAVKDEFYIVFLKDGVFNIERQ